VLTARQELVLSLTFDREMEAAEIAKLLRISPQTVRSTRHKAIERLRRHFAAEDSS
jgi:RNA polymerase sigma factor (sigma-70 family)